MVASLEIDRPFGCAKLRWVGQVAAEVSAEFEGMIAMQVRNIVNKLVNSVRTKPVWPARGTSKSCKRPDSDNRQ